MPIIIDPNVPDPPPPLMVTSPDGRLTATIDPDGAGVLLEADFSDLENVAAIRFTRGGTPVASGHDATAIEGKAIAYDRFAPIGVPSRWLAYPIFNDGTIGTPSDALSAIVPDTGCPTFNTWVKSVEDPAASLQLIAIEPLPVFTKTARSKLSGVVNSKYRAGSWDVHLGWETTMSFLTQDAISQKSVERLVTSGPVLLQMTRRFNIDEMFCAVGDLEMAPYRNMVSGQHVWTVPLSQIAEPSTVDAGLYIPGRSYDEIGAQVSNYNERETLWPTYDDVLGLSS